MPERDGYLLDEQVELLSDLPAGIAPFGRDALQVAARQAGNAAPRKRLAHLRAEGKGQEERSSPSNILLMGF